jgi:hypothetical protein
MDIDKKAKAKDRNSRNEISYKCGRIHIKGSNSEYSD